MTSQKTKTPTPSPFPSHILTILAKHVPNIPKRYAKTAQQHKMTTTKWYPQKIQDQVKLLARNSILSILFFAFPLRQEEYDEEEEQEQEEEQDDHEISHPDPLNAAKVETKAPDLQASGDGTDGRCGCDCGSSTATSPRWRNRTIPKSAVKNSAGKKKFYLSRFLQLLQIGAEVRLRSRTHSLYWRWNLGLRGRVSGRWDRPRWS